MSTPNINFSSLDARYSKPADLSGAIAAQATTDAGQYVWYGATAPDHAVTTVWVDASTTPQVVKGWSGTSWLAIGDAGSNMRTPALYDLLGWTVDPASAPAYTTPIYGKLQIGKVVWQTTQTVTNIVCAITGAGSGLSSCYLGIYNSFGTLLATTADLSVAWQTSTSMTIPLTSPVSVPGSLGGYIYIALLVGNGTASNMFTATDGSPTTLNFGLSANAPQCAYGLYNLTSLPATIDISSFTPYYRLIPFGLK